MCVAVADVIRALPTRSHVAEAQWLEHLVCPGLVLRSDLGLRQLCWQCLLQRHTPPDLAMTGL